MCAHLPESYANVFPYATINRIYAYVHHIIMRVHHTSI